jgi:histidinol-phosphate phosphatase family protein
MKNKAVFFDRDGTLNHNGDYYVYSPDKLIMNKGVGETLGELLRRGYLLFVVSNQSGIAKGLYGIKEVEAVHARMQEMLLPYGAAVNGFIWCSHHPDHGKCLCRKPSPLMIHRLAARFRVDTSSSFMIGDMQRDIDAGVAAGLRGILIEPNSDLSVILNMIP